MLIFNRMFGREMILRAPDDGAGGGGGAAPAAAAAAAAPAATGAPANAGGTVLSGDTISATVKPDMAALPPAADATKTGAAGADWKAGFTNADLVKNPTIAGIKSLDDAANMIISGEKRIGELTSQLGAKLPAADAKLEDVSKFTSQLRPEKAEGYGLSAKAPENLPEGVAFNADEAKSWEGVFHEIGLHPAQAQRLQQAQIEMAAAGAKQQQQAIDNMMAGYKQAWGNDFDANIEQAGKFLTENLSPEQMRDFSQLKPHEKMLVGLGLNAALKQIQPGTMVTANANTGGQGGAETLASLQQQMQQLQSDPAYFNEQVNRVRHQELRGQVSQISAKIANLQAGKK